MKLFFFLCALVVLGNANAGVLYRSIDNNGKVYYSDKPLAGSEDVEKLKLGDEPPVDDSLPYETMRAKQNFPVTLYVFADCGAPCQQARDFLNKRGIPFTENNLQTQADLDAYQKASGAKDAPGLSIGKTWLHGFLAEQWGKELDVAGYSKSTPYRPRPAASAVKPAPALAP